MADERTLLIKTGAGFFAYEILETLKTFYAVGESVKIHYKVKNNGNVRAKGKIECINDDTGATITTFTTDYLEPNQSFETVSPHATLGNKPAGDWVVRCKLTP